MAPTVGSKGNNRKPKARRSDQGLCSTPDIRAKELKSSISNDRPSPGVPLELQQCVLNVFGTVFFDRFDDSLHDRIQGIKQFLFERNFISAFGQQASLEAYVMRWSPTRALAYLDIFCGLQDFLTQSQPRIQHTSHTVSGNPCHPSDTRYLKQLKVVSFGGGAGAELIALAGLLNNLDRADRAENLLDADPRIPRLSVDLVILDIADWPSVISKLHSGIANILGNPRNEPSGATKSKASMIDHDRLRVTLERQDLLEMETAQMGPILEDCALVTLMFTLNELYSTSINATTHLLLSMTPMLKPGSLLLVTDSPGSYSTVSIAKTKDGVGADSQKGSLVQKKYPMLWLLDHTLLEAASVGYNGGRKQWEKLQGNESKWFRLSKDLDYPIALEDMRYQLLLYRRL